jgi:hypothetical protein
VHFEEVEGRMENMSGAPGHQEVEEEDRTWYSGTYGDEGLKTKVCSSHILQVAFADTSQKTLKEEADEDYDMIEEDPYPPFPTSLPEDDPLFAAPTVNRPATAKGTIPTPTSGPVTIDDAASHRLCETGIIIGRALPQACHDPNLRPTVRAFINKVGSLVAYIPGIYAKRKVSKGDVQIAMKDVDYTPELAVIPFGEHRSKAIKKLIEASNATHDAQRTSSLDFEAAPDEEPNAVEEHDFITIDDSQHQRLRQEGIIIGVAKPHFCRVSHERPVVRAMLNTRNAVIAFIPGKYAKVLNRELTGEVQIPMKDVDYGRQLADLSLSEIVDMVRERLVKKGEKMRKEAEEELEGYGDEEGLDEEVLEQEQEQEHEQDLSEEDVKECYDEPGEYCEDGYYYSTDEDEQRSEIVDVSDVEIPTER